MRLRAALGLLLVAVVSHAPTPAAATTCYPQAAFWSLPTPLTAAPPNTHFWLFAPANWSRRICTEVAFQTGDASECDEGQFSLRLVEAPSRTGARPQRPIPADLRVHSNEKVAVVELIPRSLLPAGRRYDAEIVDEQGRFVRLAGTFKVKGLADREAPAWSGITGAWGIHPEQPVTDGKRGIVIDMTEYKPGISVQATPPVGSALFAVWVGEVGKPIDFSQPPDLYETHSALLSNGALVIDLGGSDLCWASPFVVPARDAIRLGMAAVDLAGNRSAPSQTDVALR